MPAKPLTPSQERFCQEYLVDLNATRAYKTAYPKVTENSANACGSRMLATAKVVARIRVLQEKRAQRVEVTQDWVLERLMRNVDRAMEAEPVLDTQGHATGEYRYDGAVANGALKLLGQHLGMYTERAVVEHRFIAEVPPKAKDAATWAQQHRQP